MGRRSTSDPQPRPPLTRERVLRAALDLADEGGIDSMTMRLLGQRLGVEAMSLYNHVDNKDDILDGMLDLVVGEIDLPPATSDGGRRCEGGPSRPERCSRAIPGRAP